MHWMSSPYVYDAKSNALINLGILCSVLSVVYKVRGNVVQSTVEIDI